MNIFFRQSENTGTNLQSLECEDFFGGETETPIRIRVTFGELSVDAHEAFKHYARAGKLVVTAEAKFSYSTNRADVVHYGERLGFEDFRKFFEEQSLGASVATLKEIFADIRDRYPELQTASTKDAMASSLREYESARPEQCVSIPSEDQFYGVSKGANRLERFIQWVYVPAVKDAVSEQAEARNSALSKLLSRAVNAKTAFAQELEELKASTREKYSKILCKNQSALEDITKALNSRLSEWAHDGTDLVLEWQEDEQKSVKIEEPWARVKVSEGAFEGQVARLGHGVQRSFIIALLQELALYERDDAPRLILAIEEPELYQHPPQSRHLALLLSEFAGEGAQVMVTTHSPYFISGEVFENVRLVRKNQKHESEIKFANAEDIAKTIGDCLGKAYDPPSAAIARIQQALQPQIAEMFFATRLVFVEGREDAAFIQTYLELKKYWSTFRKLGCHIVAVDGKSELLRPLVIAQILGIPSFLIFDCDGNAAEKWRHHHEIDNNGLLKAVGVDSDGPFPEETVAKPHCVAWKNCMTDELRNHIDPEIWNRCQNQTDLDFGQGGRLKKNVMHIASFVENLWNEGVRPAPLEELSESLMRFATPYQSEIPPP